MDAAVTGMQCMEVWSLARLAQQATAFSGLEAWVYSRPHAGAAAGGDVVYASSCATGRITRVLVADVAGHGAVVASAAEDLQRLMRRFVNCLDQTEMVRRMNRQFAGLSRDAAFATALVATYFAPTRRLTLSIAGHPRPLHFVAATGEWRLLGTGTSGPGSGPRNVPLGLLELADYDAADVELQDGDVVVAYTDALIESPDHAGTPLGETGVLDLVRALGRVPPATLIERLLGLLHARLPDRLEGDDATIVCLHATPHRMSHGWRARLQAFGRLCRAALGAVRPGADGPPVPDWTLANIGGALVPALEWTWRRRDSTGASASGPRSASRA